MEDQARGKEKKLLGKSRKTLGLCGLGERLGCNRIEAETYALGFPGPSKKRNCRDLDWIPFILLNCICSDVIPGHKAFLMF